MTNHMTNAQAFDRAFAPNYQPTVVNGFLVQILSPGIAHITDGDVTLAVAPHYCAHCRDDGTDGEAMCVHKEALFLAEHPAGAPDIDDRREAYYAAGIYPPQPVR